MPVYCILLFWYRRNYDEYPSKKACRREAPKIFKHFSLVVWRSPEGHIMIEIATSVCSFDLQAHLPSLSGGQMYLWWQLPLQPRSCGKSFSYATDPTSCACYTRPSSIEGEVLFLREFAKICQNRIYQQTGCPLKLLAFFVCVLFFEILWCSQPSWNLRLIWQTWFACLQSKARVGDVCPTCSFSFDFQLMAGMSVDGDDRRAKRQLGEWVSCFDFCWKPAEKRAMAFVFFCCSCMNINDY